jgi:excisionase family DNA binding protein
MRDSFPDGHWMSTREAAARLNVSEASVRRWSDEGVLPARRVGGRRERRFRHEDVERVDHSRRAASATLRPGTPSVSVAGLAIEASTHLAAFYDSDPGRLRLSVPFLADGLRSGQPCFLMAHGEELHAYLHALGRMPEVDLDEALADGRLVVAPGPGATVKEALDFWEQALWTAVASGASVTRIVGEMASVRSQFTTEAEMLTFEVALSITVKRFSCVVICQYDARRFSGQALLSAFLAHPDLFNLPLGRFLN